VNTITSRQNPLVAKFRNGRMGRLPKKQVLLDGARLIEDAQDSKVKIDVALFSVSALKRDARLTGLAKRLADSGARVLNVSEVVMRAVSPVQTPSGVVAIAIHQPYPLTRIMNNVKNGLVLVAVGVQNPGNVGSIIRTAEAGGANAVIATEGTADPFGWKALRGAMGSSFRLPVASTTNLKKLLSAAKQHGAKVVAAVPRGGTGLYDADLTAPTFLLVGQEGTGLEQKVGIDIDFHLSVPMQPGVESLNVSTATGLIIYEARRQAIHRQRRSNLKHSNNRRRNNRSEK
tara:strand:- start:1101 stop:1964 length:864 start_codon:yes stop_codon:yes gene_type:complete